MRCARRAVTLGLVQVDCPRSGAAERLPVPNRSAGIPGFIIVLCIGTYKETTDPRFLTLLFDF
jgi:hypothetical protein